MLGAIPSRMKRPRVVLPGSHVALALQDVNLNRGLTVGSGRVDLALLNRDSRIAVDDAVEYAAERLDTERQRSNVEKQQVLDVSAEHAALNSRAR